MIQATVSQPWIQITSFTVNFAFTVDHLTLIMLGVVTGVGFLIHIYSVGYMAHEEGYWRFFAYLNLFMFFMSVLVLAENFLLLFVGWEGVGLASYLLIGFYFRKTSAANAGRKAFVVNRIGDFGFLLAMFLLIVHFGTLNFTDIFATVGQHPEWQGARFLTAIALLLVLGAAGKSAQIPLYVWLPDAMEGPTPVSALIHAATMVTAGIYMVARCHTLFDRSPFALMVVASLAQPQPSLPRPSAWCSRDIKRVLAYSTISQLGYMFLACGVGAYAAGIFHLLTHAFFKALLFLAAGSVIHALSGEQDMRKMGGLWRRIPVTFWTMTMGVIAIAGIWAMGRFFLQGRDSLSDICFAEPRSANSFGSLAWLTAGMTSFYMFRLWFKTFFGDPRFEAGCRSEQSRSTRSMHSSTATLTLEGRSRRGSRGGHASHGVHESPCDHDCFRWLFWRSSPSSADGLAFLQRFGGHNEIEHFLDPVFGPSIGAAVCDLRDMGLSLPCGSSPYWLR